MAVAPPSTSSGSRPVTMRPLSPSDQAVASYGVRSDVSHTQEIKVLCSGNYCGSNNNIGILSFRYHRFLGGIKTDPVQETPELGSAELGSGI